MPAHIFRAAIESAGEFVTLGGGEPTLHRNFEKYLLQAIAHTEPGGVMVITNGTHKERSRMLFDLARSGVMAADLSRDDYHDEIDGETVDMWEAEAERVAGQHRRHNYDDRSRVGVRNTTEDREPMANGRARTELGLEKGDDYRCPCDGPVVQPNGDVYACGCDDAVRLGHIIDGWEMPDSDSVYYDSCCSRALLEEVKA